MAKQAIAVPSVQAGVHATTPKRRANWGIIGRYIALVVVLIIALGPFYWTAITSIKVDAEINASPPTLFPHSFTTANYTQAFLSVQPAFAKDLLNSTIVAIVTTSADHPLLGHFLARHGLLLNIVFPRIASRP
jgi:ABC-type maltose transport system permease subunit